MSAPRSSFEAAAYGGPGWSGRDATARQEIGSLWRACGISNEWAPLREILLHCPGPELTTGMDADAAHMLAPPDPGRAAAQHEAMARAFYAS